MLTRILVFVLGAGVLIAASWLKTNGVISSHERRKAFKVDMHEKVEHMTSGKPLVVKERGGFYAYRADGSFVERDGEMGTTTVFRTDNTRKYLINHDVKMVSTEILNDQMRRILVNPQNPGPQCLSYVNPTGEKRYDFDGTEIHLKVMVVKYIRQSKSKQGRTMNHTVWLAPDLDCAKLREEIVLDNPETGSVTKTTRDATSVVLGNPDPSLFEVPSGFQEVAPSVISLTKRGLIGQQIPVCLRKWAERVDSQYRHSHKPS